MRLYRVRGYSMSPFLQDGHLVLVKETPLGRYRAGNVVVFQRNTGELIVHRVVKGEEDGVVQVRGDRYGPREAVEVRRVRGKVVGVLRAGGFVRVTRAVEWYSWVLSFMRRGVARLKRGVGGLLSFDG